MSTSSADARPLPRARGITLVELIVTMAVMGIIMAATVPIFTITHRSYTSLEVNTVLPAAMQGALSKMRYRIIENKQIFGKGDPYVAVAKPNISPAVPAWSVLPVVCSTMSLSVSSGTFVKANVGNSLFFANVATPFELTLPGTSAPVKVDTFVFNYYYLAQGSGPTVAGASPIELREWHSIPYADYNQLISIVNVARATTTIAGLYANGIRYAWDSSSAVPSSAFYNVNSDGSMTGPIVHNLVTSTTAGTTPASMISVIEGAASGGFHYGVCPNGVDTRYAVPTYALGSGSFPAGLETMVVGYPSARQVFVRLVMAAQGNFTGVRSYENVLLLTTQDTN